MRIIDGQVNANPIFLTPFVNDLREIHQIIFGSRAVYNINLAITVTIMTAIVDYRMQRSQSDTAGNK